MCTDCIDEPQKRLTVEPPTVRGRPRQHGHDPAEVHALLPFGEGAAECDVFDGRGVDVGPVDQLGDHAGGEIVGTHAHERSPPRRLKRRPDVLNDDGTLHRSILPEGRG